MRRPVLSASLLRAANLAAAADPRTLEKARQHTWYSQVEIEELTPSAARLFVRGRGHNDGKVRFEVLDDGNLSCDCNCLLFTGERPCEHIIGAALTLEKHLTYDPINTWETRLQSALRSDDGKKKKKSAAHLLVFSLYKPYRSWVVAAFGLPRGRIIGPDVDPMDATAILSAVVAGDMAVRNYRIKHLDPSQFPDATEAMLTAARFAVAGTQGSYYYGETSGEMVETSLRLLHDAPVFVGTENEPLKRAIKVRPDAGRITLHLAAAPDGGVKLLPQLSIGEAKPKTRKTFETILPDPLWLLLGDELASFGSVPKALAGMLGAEPLEIPGDDLGYFKSEYLVPLAERFPLSGDALVGQTVESETVVPRLYLSEKNKELSTELRFLYGTTEVTLRSDFPPVSLHLDTDGERLNKVIRQPSEERLRFESLTEFGLRRSSEPGEFTLRARLDVVDFLLHFVPKLTEAGFEIFGEEGLKNVRVNRSTPTINFKITSGIDWFDLEAVIQFGETTASLKDVRLAIKKRERFVKLADGTIGMIPEEWIARFKHVFALGAEVAGSDGEHLRLSPLHALLLEQALTDSDGDPKADAEFAKRLALLREFDEIPETPLPKGFVGELRHYQQAGFDWLHFLKKHGFGGCLADDMGTGKTAQSLALLLSVKNESKHASLLVVPRSLVFNWEREAAKFTPSLRILRYDDMSRATDSAEFDSYDLVITTYGILLRDIEKLRAYPFFYALLDEAQAIKNPLSQTSRAARLLKAEHRLTLTGTPIENGTGELWSQFAFLNPGLLGGFEVFKESFVNPIEKSQDTDAAAALRALTKPFLLRRTKDQVATELPPRSERLVYSPMDQAQRALYDQTRDRFRSQILGLFDDGAAKTQMVVLEGLLRLRQICCHPRLVDPNSTAGSAKLEAILETLQTLRAEGHKALIFSQFTQMLAIVKEALDAEEIPYLYLDGRTKNREARVDAFQNDPEMPFFLISLKAGGVGLNLTAADYVIHIDPWWNPAVEQQATDRTHRIGQTRPVFVYKFLAEDSVEEKIVELQERKRALVDQLIQTESGLFKSLTRDDIAALFS